MPTVAEMLTEGMRRRNVTQQRLAKETGITAPWINMILRRGRAPGPAALLRIADALGIDRRKLVRRAHFERAYDEWRPYLEHGDAGPSAPLTGMVPLIGSSSSVPDGAVVEKLPRANGTDKAADAPGAYHVGAEDGAPRWFVGFDQECKAIRIEGDALEPVAYDGQYVVVTPKVRKEDVPDGAIVYVTYELPGDAKPRAMIRRVYRYRLAGEDTGKPGLPVYNFVPVNTRLREKGHAGEPDGAVTLRHRSVREMFPVVGVVFGGG
jgi:transcriptional regulator with XRE-family HTH domain